MDPRSPTWYDFDASALAAGLKEDDGHSGRDDDEAIADYVFWCARHLAHRLRALLGVEVRLARLEARLRRACAASGSPEAAVAVEMDRIEAAYARRRRLARPPLPQ